MVRNNLRLHRKWSLQLPTNCSSRYATIAKTTVCRWHLILKPPLRHAVTCPACCRLSPSPAVLTATRAWNANSVASLQDLCRARMATKTHQDKPEPIHVGQRIAGLSRESEVSNNSPSSRSSTSSWWVGEHCKVTTGVPWRLSCPQQCC